MAYQKPLCIFFACFFAACLSGCTNGQSRFKSQPDNFNLIIQNVTAIDAVHGTRMSVNIAIAGDRIASIHPSTSNGELTSQKYVDGTGKFLIPGLWDAHVHLTYNPNIGYDVFFPLALAHGITYLRDTGGQLDKLAPAKAIADSDAIAPDLFISGPLVDGAKRVYAGQSSNFPNISIGADSAEMAEAKVDALAEQGVDFIKAYEMLSPEAFRRLVDRARYHNLPVTGHSPLAMTAQQAIEAGIHDMQHLRNLELDCVGDPLDLLQERRSAMAADNSEFGGKLRATLHQMQRAKAMFAQDDKQCAALIELMKKNNVSQTPTLSISRFLSRKLFAEKRYQASFQLMPKSVANGWLNRANKLSEREPTEQDLAFDNWLMTMVARLNDAGVSILAGTDAPIAFLTPGASLHEELFMLVEAGMTPLEAIGAATVSPAAFFGLQEQQGSIAVGQKADLVLLNDDPLLDIRNIGSIEAVIKDGRFINRISLDVYRSAPSQIE